MKYYKALLFGSIGSIVETSEIQRKSFNKAFKQYGLDWNWTKLEYQNLLSKSGGKDRISKYAKMKKIKVNSVYLRNLKTKIFNNYLKKNQLKLRSGVKNLISLCKKEYLNARVKLKIYLQINTFTEKLFTLHSKLLNKEKYNRRMILRMYLLK